MLAGQGVKAIAVMWVMAIMSFVLVPLRLYTRVYIVKALGLDDHVFNLGWVSFFERRVTLYRSLTLEPRYFSSYIRYSPP